MKVSNLHKILTIVPIYLTLNASITNCATQNCDVETNNSIQSTLSQESVLSLTFNKNKLIYSNIESKETIININNEFKSLKNNHINLDNINYNFNNYMQENTEDSNLIHQYIIPITITISAGLIIYLIYSQRGR